MGERYQMITGSAHGQVSGSSGSTPYAAQQAGCSLHHALLKQPDRLHTAKCNTHFNTEAGSCSSSACPSS